MFRSLSLLDRQTRSHGQLIHIQRKKFIGAKAFFKMIENEPYNSLRASVHHKCKVSVNCADRHIQLWMVHSDLIRRLSLLDQRSDDLVFLMQFLLCNTDATSGITE